MKFIKTKDQELAIKLRQCGMTCITQEGEYFVFLNDGKLPIMYQDNTKLFFTDKLMF